jgi:hypothetical protein
MQNRADIAPSGGWSVGWIRRLVVAGFLTLSLGVAAPVAAAPLADNTTPVAQVGAFKNTPVVVVPTATNVPPATTTPAPATTQAPAATQAPATTQPPATTATSVASPTAGVIPSATATTDGGSTPAATPMTSPTAQPTGSSVPTASATGVAGAPLTPSTTITPATTGSTTATPPQTSTVVSTATPTIVPDFSPTTISTATATLSPIPTASPTIALTNTPTPTWSPTPSPSRTAAPTLTPILTITPTVTLTVSSTVTSTSTVAAITAPGLAPPPVPGSAQPLNPVSNFQTLTGNTTNETFLLNVPYRSQYDGSAWQNANCGPASLAMVLLAYGLNVSNQRIRDIADSIQGTNGYNDGIALVNLQIIAKQTGLTSQGLFDLGGHYHQWTMGDVIREVRRGYPVITLVHFASLPAHASSSSASDHYIVIVGVTATGFIINDPASSDDSGFQQILRPEDLLRAWHDAGVSNQAIAFLPPSGTGGLSALRPLAEPSANPTAIVMARPAVALAGPSPIAAAPAPIVPSVDPAIQAGDSLPPPNPSMVDWAGRVGSWLRPSPLPTIQANANVAASAADDSIVLAARGTSSPSPLPLLLVLGIIAAAAGGILCLPGGHSRPGQLDLKRASRDVTVRDPRTVNRLAPREPRQLPPPT